MKKERLIAGEYTFEEAVKSFLEIRFTYEGKNYELDINVETDEFEIVDDIFGTGKTEWNLYANFGKEINDVINGEVFGRPFRDVLYDSEVTGLG